MNDGEILDKFDKLVTKLNETPGTNAKLALLQTYPELQPLIKRVWDPNTKTGVTAKSIAEFDKSKPQSQTMTLYELFDSLTGRSLTGDAARGNITAYIARYPKYSDVLIGIFTKQPRVRMAGTLILKAFPGIFDIFRVALAEEYTEEIFTKELAAAGGVAFMSWKIDGVRLIAIIINDKIQFRSRTGHEWTSLSVLEQDLRKNVLPHLTDEERKSGVVFDGELIALDADGRENFKETVSQSRKKDIQMENPRYLVFDMLSKPEFDMLEKSPLLEERIADLEDLFKDARPKNMELLGQTRYTREAFERKRNEAQAAGREGLMIRMNTPYEGKRTKRLLKYKFFQTEEFRVEYANIVKMPFANAEGGEDQLDALKNVIIKYKDCEVSVGSGFDKDERLTFAKNPDLIVGKMISVQFQEPFYDDKKKTWSLRCPTFKALIGAERDF